jgi:Zn-dependent protease
VGVDLTQLAITLLVLLASLTVHEAAHAWSADRLGDPTARSLGRVSFNPLVHIDPIGTIVFPMVALFSSLPVIGWAKPVPVNTRNLSGDWKQKYMLIAAAGPASNLVLAVLAAIALRAVDGGDAVQAGAPVTGVLQTAVLVNVLLAVFNMIPVPPLDGGNVLAGFLRGPAGHAFDRLRPYGFLILYGLMVTGMLTTLISPPARFLLAWLL